MKQIQILDSLYFSKTSFHSISQHPLWVPFKKNHWLIWMWQTHFLYKELTCVCCLNCVFLVCVLNWNISNRQSLFESVLVKLEILKINIVFPTANARSQVLHDDGWQLWSKSSCLLTCYAIFCCKRRKCGLQTTFAFIFRVLLIILI